MKRDIKQHQGIFYLGFPIISVSLIVPGNQLQLSGHIVSSVFIGNEPHNDWLKFFFSSKIS